jgi:hypothetical protein
MNVILRDQAWRHMLTIPAIQEAEIGRIEVCPNKKLVRPPAPATQQKHWAWWCRPVVLVTQEV